MHIHKPRKNTSVLVGTSLIYPKVAMVDLKIFPLANFFFPVKQVSN